MPIRLSTAVGVLAYPWIFRVRRAQGLRLTLTLLYPSDGAPIKGQFAPTVMIGVCGVAPVSASEKNIIMKLKARLERTSVSSIQYQVSL